MLIGCHYECTTVHVEIFMISNSVGNGRDRSLLSLFHALQRHCDTVSGQERQLAAKKAFS